MNSRFCRRLGGCCFDTFPKFCASRQNRCNLRFVGSFCRRTCNMCGRGRNQINQWWLSENKWEEEECHCCVLFLFLRVLYWLMCKVSTSLCSIHNQFLTDARCLKITKKVSFNIASEASYVYILSGQKLIENAKNVPFWRVFEKLKLAVKQSYQTGQF